MELDLAPSRSWCKAMISILHGRNWSPHSLLQPSPVIRTFPCILQYVLFCFSQKKKSTSGFQEFPRDQFALEASMFAIQLRSLAFMLYIHWIFSATSSISWEGAMERVPSCATRQSLYRAHLFLRHTVDVTNRSQCLETLYKSLEKSLSSICEVTTIIQEHKNTHVDLLGGK